ncbi:hypothetical protein AJ79_03938 [Helicocarpus griseus UAMH5409]|uniref:DUF7600 domain-containing protein n=1 Tax=Helicocarpus griseus UAMH5409 TaxID=1447875 RepID=A0A2B7XVI3_9EURO|nr:hypothetical protein AJ79_03938 [Helicocarpus griseus UAMH5409]
MTLREWLSLRLNMGLKNIFPECSLSAARGVKRHWILSTEGKKDPSRRGRAERVQLGGKIKGHQGVQVINGDGSLSQWIGCLEGAPMPCRLSDSSPVALEAGFDPGDR